ncbi:MAG: DUF924 family protein [Candidatus Paracaedibacter sp.]
MKGDGIISFKSLPKFTEIVPYWFSPEVQPLWFEKNPEFDDSIRRHFGDTYQQVIKALKGLDLDKLDVGLNEALSLIILLDQFPRNMFRDKPEAFATDNLALSLSKTISRKIFETELSSAAHYNFLYMPFMHSENLKDQEEGIRLFSSIPGNDYTVSYAKLHRDIIAQFGRFPHRNKILGRASTAEEIDYLEEFQGF